ncbi:MAG: hypothetical protein JSW50_05830 [Candidatus Latescibacterota bacterium]|nr:MAG: hypothetical protein JSW50_05830 [Candidatus Latescibacterota bacterium]
MPQAPHAPRKPAVELEQVVREMEFVTRGFLSEAEKFVKAWYWQCAEFYVTKYYQKTSELGPAKLAEMKRSIQQIDAAATQLIAQQAGGCKFWTHRSRGEQWSNVDFSKGIPKDIAAAISSVTGEIKPALRRFGYLPASDKFDSDCPDPNAFPESITMLIDRYRMLIRKGLFLRTEIRNAEEDQQKREALNMWRQI